MLLLFGFVDDLVIIKYSNEKCHELILQKLAFEKKIMLKMVLLQYNYLKEICIMMCKNCAELFAWFGKYNDSVK